MQPGDISEVPLTSAAVKFGTQPSATVQLVMPCRPHDQSGSDALIMEPYNVSCWKGPLRINKSNSLLLAESPKTI